MSDTVTTDTGTAATVEPAPVATSIPNTMANGGAISRVRAALDHIEAAYHRDETALMSLVKRIL